MQASPRIIYARVLMVLRDHRLNAVALDRDNGIASQLSIDLTRFDRFHRPCRATLPGRDGRPWREFWTFTGCGKAGEMPVQFTPDPTGTAFGGTPQVRVRTL